MIQTTISTYLGNVIVTHPNVDYSMQSEGIYVDIYAPTVGSGYDFSIDTSWDILGHTTRKAYNAVLGAQGRARIYLDIEMLPNALMDFGQALSSTPLAIGTLNVSLTLYEADIEDYRLDTASIIRGLPTTNAVGRYPWRVIYPYARIGSFAGFEPLVAPEGTQVLDLCNAVELCGCVDRDTVNLPCVWTARRVESKSLGEYYFKKSNYTPSVSMLTYDVESAWELSDEEMDIATRLFASPIIIANVHDDSRNVVSQLDYASIVTPKSVKADYKMGAKTHKISCTITLPTTYSTDCLINI